MSKRKQFAHFLSVALIGSAAIWSFVHMQDIADWWRLRQYVPDASIVTIADTIALSDEGRRLFYLHDPELLADDSFTSNCSVDEKTIVLGCYQTNTRIFIFDVADSRIDGVEEVTAGHEMLHAAYDRLSDSERSRIDSITERTFASLDSPRLQKTIESYKSRDPSVVPNELHSILGTEVRNLPIELEQYYSRYFIDRSKIVAIAEAYEKEFTSREDKIAEYDKQLEALNQEITQQQSELEELSRAIDFQRSTIESLRTTPEAYNAQVPSFNAKVNQYNSLASKVKVDIDTYNQLVVDRNAIAIEEKELFDAIDSRQQLL